MAKIQQAGTRYIEIVHSPDDGGWYVLQTDTFNGKTRFRTSKQTFRTHAEAEKAYLYGDVKWSKWN